MKIKRFVSTSMQDALRMVREDFGPDAVILSNTRVDEGVEIVAALDYEEEMAKQAEQPSILARGGPSPSQLARMHAEKHIKLQKEMDSARRRIEDVRSQRQRSTAKTPPVSAADRVVDKTMDRLRADKAKVELTKSKNTATPTPTKVKTTPEWADLSDMRAEILELKGLINDQVSGVNSRHSTDTKTLAQRQAEKALDSLCLSKSIQKTLLESIKNHADFDQAWNGIRQQIEGAIVVAQTELIDQGGIIALVGPTGSGKTMTIGKMAARYVMKYGSESVALVTTDRYRIAAHEQLKVFGRILNVPVHAVDEAHSLDSILGALKGKKLVLIDTAGLIHFDACWSEQLQELKMSAHDIKNYLVVSAVGQYQVMCSNYYNYKVVGLAGAIITKVDEAVSLGEVLSFLIDTRMRASYYTNGQRVPEDIHLIGKTDLFSMAESLLNSSERWITISAAQGEPVRDSLFFHSA